MAPHNMLLDDHGAHLIDWAWPTRGPAWVDPAVWVLRLLEAGHTPEQADRWASRLPAWRAAPPATLAAFADANAALWADLAAQDPTPHLEGRPRRQRPQLGHVHPRDPTRGSEYSLRVNHTVRYNLPSPLFRSNEIDIFEPLSLDEIN